MFYGEEEYNPEEQADPFSQLTTAHPALGESLDIAPNIYESLFDDVFDSEIFNRWVQHKTSWQLHCLGGPGAGKTTFATLAAKRVHKKYAQSLDITPYVAAVFIHDGIIENELAFLEDFLDNVYNQLTPLGLLVRQATSKSYVKYSNAKYSGKRTSIRVDLIARALRQRVIEIIETGRAFLVVDNIDQCSPSLQELLERELSKLQIEGFSIMITLRLPKHEKLEDLWCDFHEPGQLEDSLQFYWRCMSCEDHYMCEACASQDKVCIRCGADTDWAEPQHLNMSINSIHENSMKDFIAWDLEREHGDLGLGTLISRKPPLSSFGIAFRKAKPGASGHEWVQEVFESVNGSVVQTKLALDRIHSSTSPNMVDFNTTRIPTNVQSLFNEALKQIEEQPVSQRELALKSIAAVGKTEDMDFGIPLSRLASLLKERPSISTSTRIPPRSAEDILNAANGYLRLMAPRYDGGEYAIAAFNILFYMYVLNDYNDELIMANSQLRTSNIPRSFTRVLPKDNTGEPAPSWEDILGDLKRFQSPKLSAMSARKSPPIRRESSGPFRSHTFISPGTSRVSSPPTGLGLGF
ncbi:hypothetical protein BKA66DRAFT_430832 [Pyrenochaeta sp. MPI-SDFR-AT-0127]|nr:hypothetical protein BKA66DRAFT_430832 [Pyrenochaeta sp. MPI-SDFR-AT-0127]